MWLIKKHSKWCAFFLLLRFLAVGMALDVMCYIAPVEASSEIWAEATLSDESDEFSELDCDDAVVTAREELPPSTKFLGANSSTMPTHPASHLPEFDKPPRLSHSLHTSLV